MRLRRADRSVIVAIGLRRNAADRLATQLAELLTTAPAHSTQPARPRDRKPIT